MRALSLALVVLVLTITAARTLGSSVAHGARFERGWTAYAPLSVGDSEVLEYTDVVVAPPGAIPAARMVVPARSHMEIQVIR